MKMALSNITRQPADGAYQLVKNLLAKAHAAYDMTYRGYLANHLPHGLYTLCVLGGTDEFKIHSKSTCVFVFFFSFQCSVYIPAAAVS